jgi:hypothetical protein
LTNVRKKTAPSGNPGYGSRNPVNPDLAPRWLTTALEIAISQGPPLDF